MRDLVASGCDFVVTTSEEAHREGATTGARIALFLSRILDAMTGAGPMHYELFVESLHASQADADPQGLVRRSPKPRRGST